MNRSIETALQNLGLILVSNEGLNAENAGRLISDLSYVVRTLATISTLPALGLYLKEDQLGNMRSQFADGSHIAACSEFDGSGTKGLANFTFRQIENTYKGWVITENGMIMSTEICFVRMNETPFRPVSIKSVQLQVCEDEGLLDILPNSESESYKYLLRNIAVMIRKQTERYLVRIAEKVKWVQDTDAGLRAFRAFLG